MSLPLTDVVQKYHLKTGVSAMQSCGVQMELAAHLMLMASGTKSLVILRAGQPPNYDRPIAAKPGNIRSKSSKDQGFFNGYIAADYHFSRIERDPGGCVTLRGLHEKDLHRLEEPITAPDHLYTLPLKVTLKEIVDQLKPAGDLLVHHFNPITGILELRFKPGKGSPKHPHIFIINLRDGIDFIPHFSRPWNAPSGRHAIPEELSKMLRSFMTVDPDYFITLCDKEFIVNYLDHETIKPAKIFARTPQTLQELQILLEKEHPSKLQDIQDLSFAEALQFLGPEFLQELYSKNALPITGDWDGLAIGHPNSLDPKYLKAYNTFLGHEHSSEVRCLLSATEELLQDLKSHAQKKPQHLLSAFDEFVTKINFHQDLCDEFCIARAGIVTPYEFLFQQLTNHAYRQKTNEAFGEQAPMQGMQETLDSILAYSLSQDASWNSCVPQRVPNKLEVDGLVTIAKAKLTAIRRANPVHKFSMAIKIKSDAHLEHTIRTVLSPKNFTKLRENALIEHSDQKKPKHLIKISHPDADPNIQNPFQHGVDMHSPYKPEADGSWVVITPEGMIIHGESQMELIPLLLSDDSKLLQTSYFDVHPLIDMRRNPVTGFGWTDIVKKQLAIDKGLGLTRVSLETKQSHKVESLINYLEEKYANRASEINEYDIQILDCILKTQFQHNQIVSKELLAQYLAQKSQLELEAAPKTAHACRA